jgi:hypothetical protein
MNRKRDAARVCRIVSRRTNNRLCVMRATDSAINRADNSLNELIELENGQKHREHDEQYQSAHDENHQRAEQADESA